MLFFSGLTVVASFICSFSGDFFFRPLVTWVHPSLSLLGWSPVSVLGRVVAAVVVVVVVVVVNGVGGGDVGGGDVGLLVFCGQDREKCPSCLQNQHCGFLPSTITVITWLSYSIV